MELLIHCGVLETVNVSESNNYFISKDGIIFNKEMTEIKYYPSGKKDTEYIIPEGITHAVINNIYLKKILLPDSMNDFSCEGESLEEIVANDANEYYTTIDGVLYTKNIDKLIYYPQNKNASTYTIPEGVLSVEFNILSTNNTLQTLNIPASLKIIGSATTEYGWYALNNETSNIKEINVNSNNSVYSSEDGILYDKDKTTLLCYPKNKDMRNYTIPDTVKTIQCNAISYNDSITILEIPGTVEIVEDISNCKNLRELKLNEGIKSVQVTLSGCKVKNIDIPASVTTAFIRSSFVEVEAINVSTNNQKYYSNEGVLFTKDTKHLSIYPMLKTTSTYYIPDDTQFINNAAFDYAENLENLYFPSNVSVSGNYTTSFCRMHKKALTFHVFKNSIAEESLNEWAYGGMISGIYHFEYIDEGGVETQEISVASSFNKTYGDSKFNLNAKAKTTLSYNTSNAGVATVSDDGVVTIKGAGKATITITAATTEQYKGATKEVTINVEKATPEIKFENKTISKLTGDSAFINKLTVTTDGTVSYSSSNESVATVDKTTGKVTIKGAGTATISASASEGGNYKAGNAEYSLTVTQAESRFDLDSLTYSFSNSYSGLGYSYGDRIPLSSYKLIYNETAAKFYYADDGEWGGSCYGMSATSGIFNKKYEKTTDFNSTAVSVKNLKIWDKNSKLNITVKQFIEAMQVSQYDPSVVRVRRNNTDLDKLCSVVKQGNDPVIIAVCGPQGGHALVGYDFSKISDTESRLYVYDCNYPDTERYIKLKTTKAGKCTGWYYHMNNSYNWGSSYSDCDLSYIPYETYMSMWKNRPANKNVNVLYADSDNFEIENYDGDVVAYMKDGVLHSNINGIYQCRTLAMTVDENETDQSDYIYLPRDVYTIIDTDEETDTLDAAMINDKQSSSISTDSDEVTFAVNDDDETNMINISAKKGETYEVELNSSLNDSDKEVKFAGVGAGQKISLGETEGKYVMTNCPSVSMQINGTDVGTETSSGLVNIKDMKLKLSSYKVKYTGKVQEPGVTVKDGNSVLQEGIDYVVIYSDNIKPGTATATAYGVGKYTGSISESFEIVRNSDVERVYGKGRIDTCIKVADKLKQELGVNKFDNIVIATAYNFADALPGSYIAAEKNAPILLIDQTYAKTITEYVNNNMKSGGTVYVLGGDKVVPNTWLAGIDGKIKRLGGSDRYDTNIKILKEVPVQKTDTVMVCTGINFADSLSASATGNPIMLVNNKLTSEQIKYLESIKGCDFCMIGGIGAVPESIAKVFKAYDGDGKIERASGFNRFETSVNVAKMFINDKEPASAVLAYGYNFPDGLSGGPLAYAMNAPLILTDTNDTNMAKGYISKQSIKHDYVLGGPTLISDYAIKTVFGTN